MIPVSREVIEEHARNHPCGPNEPVIQIPCPCGGCIALACSKCKNPVFVALAPETKEPCEHAKEVMAW
jgi:hypothetical protein